MLIVMTVLAVAITAGVSALVSLSGRWWHAPDGVFKTDDNS